MATQTFTVSFAGGSAPGKKTVVVSGAPANPTANQIYVGWGASVLPRRGNEIINAIKWLGQGIAERNLLDVTSPPGFKGVALVTAVNIDNRTSNNRRTSSSLATSTFAANDIVVGIGTAVTALGDVLPINTALENLQRAVIEWLAKNG